MHTPNSGPDKCQLSIDRQEELALKACISHRCSFSVLPFFSNLLCVYLFLSLSLSNI